MPTLSTVAELKRLISELSSKRQELVEEIAEIDHTFSSLGISDVDAVSTGKKRGRKPGSKNKTTKTTTTTGAKRGPKPGSKRKSKGKRGRGSFEVNGEDSVLAFVKSFGTPNAKEVNEHWSDEGRAGKADNALSKLVKMGTLKRVHAPGERGSRYAIA